MRPKQFDVWLADLNPPKGTEPGKVRPVVVVQTDLLNPHHPSTIILPISTSLVEEVHLLRIRVPVDGTGLDRTSDILLDQIRAIDNRRLIQRLGTLDDGLRFQLRRNLRILLDIDLN